MYIYFLPLGNSNMQKDRLANCQWDPLSSQTHMPLPPQFLAFPIKAHGQPPKQEGRKEERKKKQVRVAL